MIILEPTKLHWIKDDGSDNPEDLCAHSPVQFEIDGNVLVKPDDGDWTVSATSIFLLRSLSRNHTKENTVGAAQIFPCCGHGIYDLGEPEVLIMGCPSGIDLEIYQNHDSYKIVTEDDQELVVSSDEWKSTVHRFSSKVLSFYEASLPKQPFDDESQKGFNLMMSEWRELQNK